MSEAAGYVLAGGKSSRLGRDKAFLPIGEQPLVLRLAEVVRLAAGQVTLVGPPEKYAGLGLRVIPDSVRDFGPLAGLLAALEDSSSPWNLVVACDMPCLTSDFLKFLLRRAAELQAGVLLPVDAQGRDEPLCAVYSLRVRETIRRQVERGVRKVTQAFEGLKVQRLPPADYAPYDPQGRLFANINTPEDLRRAELS